MRKVKEYIVVIEGLLDNLMLFFFDFASYSIFFDFSLTVKAAPHECVIRTSLP